MNSVTVVQYLIQQTCLVRQLLHTEVTVQLGGVYFVH